MDKLYNGRRYFSADEYFKSRFGFKVYRLALSAGCTCPNRDGHISFGGCSFCSEGGSGDFAGKPNESVSAQIEEAKSLVSAKASGPYIAYFQSFTNTYGDTERLNEIFKEAINHPDIIALDIATRPDCLEKDKIDMLAKLNKIKPVMVELGLQTIHESSAQAFNRGYELEAFEAAVENLYKAGIEIIVHLILGLKGETHDDMLESVRYISDKYPVIKGVKLSMLHILKGTRLAQEYEAEHFHVFSREEYTETLIDCLEVLHPQMVVHRITGDGPKRLLIEPLWSADKKRVLNGITKRLKERNTHQGIMF